MPQYLDQKLKEYSRSEIYPFHMPGHKRGDLHLGEPAFLDITEIDGFDNLHHAEGIIREAEERAAKLWHAEKSFYLVNGSTCGLLTAISAAVPKNGTLLMARNCHKAVYHAVFLNGLKTEYLYPAVTKAGIQGMIPGEEIEKKLAAGHEIQAVIITSPTYDGVVSDIKKIAETVHRYGIPLIVDEAHGAHFGFHERLPESAVTLGADAVIQSLHKTLPSLTQTAVLHLCSDRIKEEKIRKYLGIFETSSPSYVLMAGMDSCVRLLEEKGQELFTGYLDMLSKFYRSTENFKLIKVLQKSDFSENEICDLDPSKILMKVEGERCGMSGQELYRILLERYGLQMEMCQGNVVTAMTSIMDRPEGFQRLYWALSEIDGELQKTAPDSRQNQENHAKNGEQSQTAAGKRSRKADQVPGGCGAAHIYTENPVKLKISEAEEAEAESVELSFAKNRISAEYLYLYPPGIPFLVPGEEITDQMISNIRKLKAQGQNIQGTADPEIERINVVKF